MVPFYALKRGHHINALGGFTTTSNLAFMNYHLLDYLNEISPRPILIIVGDRLILNFSVKKHLIKPLNLKNYML